MYVCMCVYIGLASLALAASSLPPLGDLSVWRRLAEEAEHAPPTSYTEDSISLLASIIARPVSYSTSASSASSSSSTPAEEVGGGASGSLGEGGGVRGAETEAVAAEGGEGRSQKILGSTLMSLRPLAGNEEATRADQVHTRLYQSLLAAVCAIPPEKLRWETLGHLVAAQRHHRRTGHSETLTADSPIDATGVCPPPHMTCMYPPPYTTDSGLANRRNSPLDTDVGLF